MSIAPPAPRLLVEILDGPVHDAIVRRSAVRSFTAEEVSHQAVDRLLVLAVHAPSAANSQPWVFAVVQNRAILERYSQRVRRIVLGQPVYLEFGCPPDRTVEQFRTEVAHPAYDVFHGAGTLVVIYATYAGGIPACFAAAENLMLGAYTMGLGTCPVGMSTPLFECSDVKEELSVPQGWVAALPIAIGHPAHAPEPVQRNPPFVTAWLRSQSYGAGPLPLHPWAAPLPY